MREIPVTDKQEISRKKFLTWLSIGSGAFAALVVSIPFFGALLDPLLRKEKTVWRKVGKVQDFPLGSTKLVVFVNAQPKPYSGSSDRSAAWLRHEAENIFIAFSVNCTHLGCPVRWEEKAELFMCPCHGGVYNKNGSVAAGPPPKELQQYGVRINGEDVEIATGALPLTGLKA